MSTDKLTWDQLHAENGVLLGKVTPDYGQHWFVVADEDFKHYRLSFYSYVDGSVSVRVDAEWSDMKPGNLANLTYDIQADCGPNDTLSIADGGLLTVFRRARMASNVDFRNGFVLQLPVAFVPVVRKAINLVRAGALLATGAISVERFQALEAQA